MKVPLGPGISAGADSEQNFQFASSMPTSSSASTSCSKENKSLTDLQQPQQQPLQEMLKQQTQTTLQFQSQQQQRQTPHKQRQDNNIGNQSLFCFLLNTRKMVTRVKFSLTSKDSLFDTQHFFNTQS